MDKLVELLPSFVPIIKAGLLVTIPLTLISFVLGLCIAIAVALIRISKYKLPRLICSAYIWVIRGTPLIVQLFIVFYGLPKAGIQLDAWSASIIALSLNVGAYCSEIVRASIISIPKGQWEAAQALGMSKPKILRRIIFPQATRIALPPLSNSFISLVKDTSLVASVTITEMFRVGQQIAARTYEPLIVYVQVAIVYLAFCTVLTILQGTLEKHFSKHERKI